MNTDDEWQLVSSDAAADLLTLNDQTTRLVAAVEAAATPAEQRDALTALLVSDNPRAGLRLLEIEGTLARLLPDIAALRDVSQRPDHAMDVLDHSLAAVEAAPATPLSRWTALFHDSGKATTGEITPEGRRRFFGHEDVGAALVRTALPRLALSPSFVAQVACLIELHLRPLAYTPEWTDGAVRRLLEEAGPLWEALLAQARADLLGYLPEPIERGLARLEALEARVVALQAPTLPPPPGSPLDGDELQRLFGRPPGPWLGAVKSALEAAVQAGTLAADDKATALTLAAQVVAEWDGADRG